MRILTGLLSVLLVLLLLLLILWPREREVSPPQPDPAKPREPAVVPPPPVEPPAAEPFVTPDAPPPGSWRISVRCFRPDGAPLVAQISAKFRSPGSRRPSASTLTDKVSEFSLDVSGFGSLTLACASFPHPPVHFPDLSPPASGETSLDVRFTEGLEITGELIDQDGVTPVEGRVHLGALDRESWLGEVPRSAKAGKDGRFRLRGLLPGRYRVFASPADRGAGTRPVPVPEVDAGGPPLRIVFLPVARVHVRITAEGDPPEKPGITIIAIVDGEGKTVTSMSRMGGPTIDREFFVPPGQRILVRVDSAGYEQQGEGAVEIGPTDREAEIRIRMVAVGEPTAALVLRVTDSLGRPVNAVAVYRETTSQVRTGKTYRAEGGAIEVKLPPGKHRLVLGPSFVDPPLMNPVLEKPLVVELAKPFLLLAGERCEQGVPRLGQRKTPAVGFCLRTDRVIAVGQLVGQLLDERPERLILRVDPTEFEQIPLLGIFAIIVGSLGKVSRQSHGDLVLFARLAQDA